jgi:hypothetical protein
LTTARRTSQTLQNKHSTKEEILGNTIRNNTVLDTVQSLRVLNSYTIFWNVRTTNSRNVMYIRYTWNNEKLST